MSWPFALRGVAAVVVLTAFFPSFAPAQISPGGASPPVIPTPSELAPQRRPDVSSDPSLVPQAPVPRRAARPEQEVTINVTGYVLPEAAPAALRAVLPQLTAPYVGPGKSYADIQNAALEVTRYLQSELGYYLGFAYIPEQQPQGGVIQIAVLEGRLDSVDLVWKEGLPVERPMVEEILAQLKPGDVLLVRDVERVVFLVNDLRGIGAEFEVQPGRTPGTARFVVTPRATDRNIWEVEADNTNARELGRARVSATYTRNSPFHRGDSFTATAIAGQGLGFILGNYTTPVGASGLRVGLSASALKYEVVSGEFKDVGIEGSASAVSAFALYPYIRSRNLNLFFVGSLDRKAYDDSTGASDIQKRVTSLDFGITGDFRDSVMGGGINSLDAQIAHGRVSFDVPLPPSDAPDPDYTKVTFRAVRLQNLVTGWLHAYTALRLQKSFANLDVTEQFRVGGPDGVRAFTSGQGSGDSGVLATLELRLLLPENTFGTTLGGRGTVSAFVDWATVKRKDDPSNQLPGFDNTEHYGGAGVGFMWEGLAGTSFRATIANQFEAPVDLAGKYRFPRGPRVFVQLRKRF